MTTTLNTTQKDFINLAQHTQEAFAPLLQGWVNAAEEYAQLLTKGIPGGLPTVRDAVAKGFDFAEQVLNTQREYAMAVLTVSVDSAEAARKTARKTAEEAWKVTEQAAEKLTNFDSEPGDKVKVTTRANRDGAAK
jgi:hypothetical protein